MGVLLAVSSETRVKTGRDSHHHSLERSCPEKLVESSYSSGETCQVNTVEKSQIGRDSHTTVWREAALPEKPDREPRRVICSARHSGEKSKQHREKSNKWNHCGTRDSLERSCIAREAR